MGYQSVMTVSGLFRNSEWPIPENTVIPRKAADNVNRTVRNGNNNRGRCPVPESENDTTKAMKILVRSTGRSRN